MYSAIMDSLVIPLQEKLEDWKKGVINLEKEHLKGMLHAMHFRWFIKPFKKFYDHCTTFMD